MITYFLCTFFNVLGSDTFISTPGSYKKAGFTTFIVMIYWTFLQGADHFSEGKWSITHPHTPSRHWPVLHATFQLTHPYVRTNTNSYPLPVPYNCALSVAHNCFSFSLHVLFFLAFFTSFFNYLFISILPSFQCVFIRIRILMK